MKRKTINIKDVTPLYTRIITTADTYTEEECISKSGIQDSTKLGQIKDIQTVLRVGSDAAKHVKEGDTVSLTFTRYARPIQKRNSLKDVGKDESFSNDMVYEIPSIKIDGKTRLRVDCNDIEFIINDFEEIEEDVVNIIPATESMLELGKRVN